MIYPIDDRIYIDIDDTCYITGYSKKTIYKMVSFGIVPYYKRFVNKRMRLLFIYEELVQTLRYIEYAHEKRYKEVVLFEDY